MSRAKDEEKRWKEFERELERAMAGDKTMTEQEYQAWLDTLPEHVPAPTGNVVKVIFIGRGKRPGDKLRGELDPSGPRRSPKLTKS